MLKKNIFAVLLIILFACMINGCNRTNRAPFSEPQITPVQETDSNNPVTETTEPINIEESVTTEPVVETEGSETMPTNIETTIPINVAPTIPETTEMTPGETPDVGEGGLPII